MNGFILFLFLVSIVCLVAGLIQPKVFSRSLKEKANRKFIGQTFSVATILFFILFGFTSDTSSTNKSENKVSKTEETVAPKTNTGTSNQIAIQTEPSKEKPKVLEITYKEVDSWEKAGKTWRAIVFSRKPSNDELIKVAKELHLKNKTDYYNFFDDDEKLEEFKNWDINYALTTSTTAYPYPEEWAKAHELAIMNEMFSSGTMKWELSSSQTFGKLADI